ncbi:hypothetical protein [Nocardia brasiliensis]|uniref:hypothetical protein n=1 Tax=Nocardia brasiliensis TaxID=37326 RepID=UPI002454760A|nr:hypothetical protein [Nocardia brasiliensis]
MKTDRELVDEIDQLVDWQMQKERSGYDHNVNQRTCPHDWCNEDFHTLPIKQRMREIRRKWHAAITYFEGGETVSAEAAAELDAYRYDEDDSPIICPGSLFEGDFEPPEQPAHYRTAMAAVLSWPNPLLPDIREFVDRITAPLRELQQSLARTIIDMETVGLLREHRATVRINGRGGPTFPQRERAIREFIASAESLCDVTVDRRDVAVAQQRNRLVARWRIGKPGRARDNYRLAGWNTVTRTWVYEREAPGQDLGHDLRRGVLRVAPVGTPLDAAEGWQRLGTVEPGSIQFRPVADESRIEPRGDQTIRTDVRRSYTWDVTIGPYPDPSDRSWWGDCSRCDRTCTRLSASGICRECHNRPTESACERCGWSAPLNMHALCQACMTELGSEWETVDEFVDAPIPLRSAEDWAQLAAEIEDHNRSRENGEQAA